MATPPHDITGILAHHDAAIGGLSARMGHVERTLEGHGGLLQEIRTAVTKSDARPSFNPHQAVATVLGLAVLFSMVVGGIIWVTTAQFSGAMVEHKHLSGRVDKHDQIIERLTGIAGWSTRVEGPRK